MTLEEAIAIQQKHLSNWEKVLKPEAYQRLKKWAEAENESPKRSLYMNHIKRGCDLDHFINNNLLLENNLLEEPL